MTAMEELAGFFGAMISILFNILEIILALLSIIGPIWLISHLIGC